MDSVRIASLVSAARNAKRAVRMALAWPFNLLSILRGLPRIARTLYLRATGRSDYVRWRDPNSLELWWEGRTRKIAALIPSGSRVIEFGAGQRWLGSYLEPGCSYIPSDLVSRGPGTFICDLNKRPLPDLRAMRPDVAVFIGVMEYIKDVPSIAAWLSHQVRICVASYTCEVTAQGTPRRLLANLRRAYYHYLNTYSESEFVELFARCGFACIRVETWNDQRLFLFELLSSLPL
jgi:Methyltransferase domain